MALEKHIPPDASTTHLLKSFVGVVEMVRNRVNIALLRIEGHTIGEKVYIEKGVTLRGKVTLGAYTKILSGARIEDSLIGACCEIGGEIKRSELGNFVKAKHRCTIADAKIGSYSNIAAGVVFGNYNGINKGNFELGEGVFVGANTTLVLKSGEEPRTLGNWSFVPPNVALECDVPDLGRFISGDKNIEPSIHDTAVTGGYIRANSGINVSRKNRVHGSASPTLPRHE